MVDDESSSLLNRVGPVGTVGKNVGPQRNPWVKSVGKNVGKNVGPQKNPWVKTSCPRAFILLCQSVHFLFLTPLPSFFLTVLQPVSLTRQISVRVYSGSTRTYFDSPG